MSWQTLSASHFYDCDGAACDAPILQPWEAYQYSFSPRYAPMTPTDGVGAFGETLWLVGAASDALSTALGADDPCCGADVPEGQQGSSRGGCGKCILVRTPPNAARTNLTAIVMKKSRCPPWTNLCNNDRIHMDFAAPGFDYAAESTSSDSRC